MCTMTILKASEGLRDPEEGNETAPPGYLKQWQVAAGGRCLAPTGSALSVDYERDAAGGRGVRDVNASNHARIHNNKN